ncbi:MAG TPA: hypothetical protein VGI20_13695, partial [Rhizomicrobium sp.]
MLKLAEQKVLLAYPGLKVASCVFVQTYVDQRGEPERGMALLIFDEVRIGIYDSSAVPGIFEPKRTNKLRPFRNGRTEHPLRVLTVAVRSEYDPRLAFDFGGTLACQFLEFGIGIDDSFTAIDLRHDDRNGYLIEKIAKALASERVCEMRRCEQMFDFRFCLVGNHGPYRPRKQIPLRSLRRLLSRFQISHDLDIGFRANFGIGGHRQSIDSDVVSKFASSMMSINGANFETTTLVFQVSVRVPVTVHERGIDVVGPFNLAQNLRRQRKPARGHVEIGSSSMIVGALVGESQGL